MRKQVSQGERFTGNDAFEGYSIDLIAEIAKIAPIVKVDKISPVVMVFTLVMQFYK